VDYVGGCGYLWGEEKGVVVVVVGCWYEEITRGWGFGPAKPKTGPHGLGIGSGLVIPSTGSAEGVRGGVDIAVKMLGGSV
jgi:hypothetical protein